MRTQDALFVSAFLLLVFVPGHGAAVQSLGGCNVLPADNIWNTPVDSLPVDPLSSSYIGSIGATTGLHPDFGSGLWDGGPIGIPYNIVTSAQAGVPVTFDYARESDPGQYPIPANPIIEGGPESTRDRHILILNRDTCTLYELFSAYLGPCRLAGRIRCHLQSEIQPAQTSRMDLSRCRRASNSPWPGPVR
ncbi:MAG: hypothetical protein LUQ32_10290 [Methanomicrobiales archaeon]|nr:hypothetical protein [Methanomicrobiales archaeon]